MTIGRREREYPRAIRHRASERHPIINAGRALTPDTALRLAQVTGMSADFWLGLQQDWDLWHAMRSEAATEIGKLEPL